MAKGSSEGDRRVHRRGARHPARSLRWPRTEVPLRYLLDTNILSELWRPKPNRGVTRCFERHRAEAVTASVVLHEILFGIERLPPSRRRADLEQFASFVTRSFPVLPYDHRAAEWHAIRRAQLASAGRAPAFEDGQIAATAAVNDTILVTENVRHFESFTDLDVETWFSGR